ncbi:hypothetical protein NMG60_11034775 [Bertholletia excelsa]
MPFPMKIQPIDFQSLDELTRNESVKPAAKSRLKRWLFERQFPNVLKASAIEKITGVEENKDVTAEFEPSSVCLANMVQNFIEDNDKQSAMVKCGRNRCNCFNGNSYDSSEDELETLHCYADSNLTLSGDACEILKSLVPCASVTERNLLADTSKIVDKNKISKCKDDFCRKIVTEGLLSLGYDASICKSRWEKTHSYPAGEYEYVDVVVEGERLIVDIDFRSEFDIARSTKSYKAVLQTLPPVFVGKADRLQTIISIACEAAKQSLKKKGMHFPPWRKAEYVKAKWLSPYVRATPPSMKINTHQSDPAPEKRGPSIPAKSSSSALHWMFRDRVSPTDTNLGVVFTLSDLSDEEDNSAVKNREQPEIKPMNSRLGTKTLSGLASVIEDKTVKF